MHSRLLVSGLPRSLPSLPHSPAPPCLPCVEGRQRAAPHSSEFPPTTAPPTTAPLQNLYMDVWGPAPVGGTDQERYFLLVVDDYTRYTTVFPLRRKAEVSGVLIPWIRATHQQLHERFIQDFPVMRLHSDRGGEFSSDLLAEFCRDKGIVQSFTFLASPQQNGIGERRIVLIMEVARTSMVHAAAPHFLWPFAVRYAAHQLHLWPRVSEPETSPTLRWTGKVGDVSVFRLWGVLSLVRDAKVNKLSSCTLCCVFLGFPTDALPWQFYHPRSRRVFSSQDVTFDESVCFYRLHPHVSHPGLAPSGVSQVDLPPLVQPLEVSFDSSGPAEGGHPAADDTAATRRSPHLETPPAETAGAESGGAEPEGEGCGGAGSGGGTTGGAGSWSAATVGADSGGPTSPSGGGAGGDPAGGPGAGQPPQPDLLEMLSPQAIRALVVRQGSPGGGGCGPASVRAASPGGTTGAGGTGGTAGAGGTGGTAGAGGAASAGGTRGAAGAGGAGATSPRGATGAAGAGHTSPGGTASAGGAGGAGAAGPGGAHSGGAGAAGAGGAVRAGGPTGAAGSGGTGGAAGSGAARAGGTAGAGGAGGAAGAAGTGGVGGTIGARGPRATGASGAAGARGAGVATGAAGVGSAGAAGAGGAGVADSVLCQVLGLPSSTALTPPLLCPPATQYQPQLLPESLLHAPGPHTEVIESLSERREPETRASTPVRARRVARPRPPAVPRTHGMALRPSSIPQCVVLPELPTSSLPHFSDPESVLSRAASPTVTHLLATVVTDPDLESAAVFALVTELVEFAARSRLDYVASLVTESESVCPPFVGDELALGSEVLDDRQYELECLAATLPRFASMLLCPEGDLDALDIPTPRSYAEAIAAQRDYKLHSLDFSTDFLQGSLHEEIWLRRPPRFTGSFPAGTQWSLRRPVYGLHQAPREWHDTLRTTLAAPGFAPSSADPSLFLRTYTTLPSFYVLVYIDDLVFATADTEALALVLQRFAFQFSSPQSTPLSTGHSLSAPPSDESVEPSGLTSGMGLVLGGQGSVVLTGQSDASWADNQATQRSSQGYTFSLGSGSVSWRSTGSSSVLGSSCEAEIYAGAMAAQELRWLTYLLTDLGERPRSPPVLYVDNKAILALCHEQRLEHKTKHIAFRYFLTRELL
ncbi:unnamed protein product [Closterium sp. NIES-54]